jgi:hypothetical protein
MLPNEVFALECIAKYKAQGLIVDSTNGEFAHCPYPEGMGDSGYYLLHNDHQHQGILQSRDFDRLCFWVGHAKQWLLNCDPLPDNYFELWDIYEQIVSKHSAENGKKSGREGGKKSHANRNEEGKSIRAVDHMNKLNAEKDVLGRSLNSVKAAEKTNSVKDERGKSAVAVKAITNTNKQLWESTIDGFRSNPGNVARHNRAIGGSPNDKIRVV